MHYQCIAYLSRMARLFLQFLAILKFKKYIILSHIIVIMCKKIYRPEDKGLGCRHISNELVKKLSNTQQALLNIFTSLTNSPRLYCYMQTYLPTVVWSVGNKKTEFISDYILQWGKYALSSYHKFQKNCYIPIDILYHLWFCWQCISVYF